MTDNENQFLRLLERVQHKDPALYSAILLLGKDVYNLFHQVNPPQDTAEFLESGLQLEVTPDVSSLTAVPYSNNLRLSWPEVSGATRYELRFRSGTSTDWDTATSLLITSSLTANLDPIIENLTVGTWTFLIKAQDVDGDLSENATTTQLIIGAISGPVISSTVLINFIVLSWTVPTSTWQIAYYNVYKDGVLQGTVSGSFEIIFELVAGTYAYTIEAVDIVGNVSSTSAVANIIVGPPSDFELVDTITSTFTGAKTQCRSETHDGTLKLLACINITETFQQHFVNNGWATPQAQVTAGYPRYIQPTKLTGQYIETFDFGLILQNVTISMVWNTLVITGAGLDTSTSTIETSTDNITWTAAYTGTSKFYASLRYVRWTMNFTSLLNTSMDYIYNLQAVLDVHREQDGGDIDALGADVGGTVVTFNKSFKEVEAIEVSVKSTTEKKAIYDFAFPVNPTTFKVLVFNSAGVRVDALVTWMARGVI